MTPNQPFPYLSPRVSADEPVAAVADILTTGGDERIVLDRAAGLNKYFSAPYPSSVLAYASSTANDLSLPAFRHLSKTWDGKTDYATALEDLRARIRAAYGLSAQYPVAFAASGTDLEYLALAAVHAEYAGKVHNVLLGADEVGSGCIHSAHGRYFASCTPRGVSTGPGSPVRGLEDVTLTDIPVRTAKGAVRTSDEIVAAIDEQLTSAVADNRHTLVHVVHGSKTGLILPDAAGLGGLQERWGDRMTVVVDACQARITSASLQTYLQRGAIVLLTGSKFMGGPPFSGFAIFPLGLLARVAAFPAGLATIFARAELPSEWKGLQILPDEPNLGLLARLEASIFELERFQALAFEKVASVIAAFQEAVHYVLVGRFGLPLVASVEHTRVDAADRHMLAMQTLVTLNLSGRAHSRTLEMAQALHRKLALSGLRLGQPVRCIRTESGEWGGTMRVGLSMPQVTAFAELEEAALYSSLAAEMEQIGLALSIRSP
ncbi:hypothetical protein [Qipengyuania atrilutea]|uniref:Uncharacterized protein n=1 Tax=Qipengyuania atrilutea TaxID=2744473 RepID=A0A850H565_9SPHN|nr:hypothetical protein [Actirhodobacter atriluteus]NVD44265.1 hypothetical protein [Actirhodobacter atriluteus]